MGGLFYLRNRLGVFLCAQETGGPIYLRLEPEPALGFPHKVRDIQIFGLGADNLPHLGV